MTHETGVVDVGCLHGRCKNGGGVRGRPGDGRLRGQPGNGQTGERNSEKFHRCCPGRGDLVIGD